MAPARGSSGIHEAGRLRRLLFHFDVACKLGLCAAVLLLSQATFRIAVMAHSIKKQLRRMFAILENCE